MKKILAIILAIFTVATLSACGKTSAPKEVDLNALGEKIISECAIENSMPIGKEGLADLYSIAVEDVADSVCYSTTAGAFPDEIIVIKATDNDAKTRISQALQSRLDDVKVQSENYSQENYALAQECKVLTQGDYVALFVSAKHADMEKMFNEATK